MKRLDVDRKWPSIRDVTVKVWNALQPVLDRAAVIHTDGYRVIHVNIKLMKKCDVACSCPEPPLPRVHTDIKWSDDSCRYPDFSHGWLWTAIPRVTVESRYHDSWKSSWIMLMYLCGEMETCLYVVIFTCFQWWMALWGKHVFHPRLSFNTTKLKLPWISSYFLRGLQSSLLSVAGAFTSKVKRMHTRTE